MVEPSFQLHGLNPRSVPWCRPSLSTARCDTCLTSRSVPGASAAPAVALAVDPVWAEIIPQDVPGIAEVQRLLWQHATVPIDWFPNRHRASIEALGRVQPTGRVHLTQQVDEVLV